MIHIREKIGCSTVSSTASGSRPGSKAFAGVNNSLVIFLKWNQIKHSYV